MADRELQRRRRDAAGRDPDARARLLHARRRAGELGPALDLLERAAGVAGGIGREPPRAAALADVARGLARLRASDRAAGLAVRAEGAAEPAAREGEEEVLRGLAWARLAAVRAEAGDAAAAGALLERAWGPLFGPETRGAPSRWRAIDWLAGLARAAQAGLDPEPLLGRALERLAGLPVDEAAPLLSGAAEAIRALDAAAPAQALLRRRLADGAGLPQLWWLARALAALAGGALPPADARAVVAGLGAPGPELGQAADLVALCVEALGPGVGLELADALAAAGRDDAARGVRLTTWEAAAAPGDPEGVAAFEDAHAAAREGGAGPTGEALLAAPAAKLLEPEAARAFCARIVDAAAGDASLERADTALWLAVRAVEPLGARAEPVVRRAADAAAALLRRAGPSWRAAAASRLAWVAWRLAVRDPSAAAAALEPALAAARRDPWSGPVTGSALNRGQVFLYAAAAAARGEDAGTATRRLDELEALAGDLAVRSEGGAFVVMATRLADDLPAAGEDLLLGRALDVARAAVARGGVPSGAAVLEPLHGLVERVLAREGAP